MPSPRIEKPAGLRNFLASTPLNPTILGMEFHFGDAIESAIDWIIDLINGIIENVQAIVAWLDEFRQEVVDLFTIITEEIAAFFEDPGGYLKDIFETVILPWAEEHIPWIITVVDWVTNFAGELELFFADPGGYIKEWFEVSVLPWLEENVPWVITILEWVTNFKEELELFFSDPTSYIRDKLETSEWGDLFTTWEDFRYAIVEFFQNPFDWLLDRFTDWFLGKEE